MIKKNMNNSPLLFFIVICWIGCRAEKSYDFQPLHDLHVHLLSKLDTNHLKQQLDSAFIEEVWKTFNGFRQDTIFAGKVQYYKRHLEMPKALHFCHPAVIKDTVIDESKLRSTDYYQDPAYYGYLKKRSLPVNDFASFDCKLNTYIEFKLRDGLLETAFRGYEKLWLVSMKTTLGTDEYFLTEFVLLKNKNDVVKTDCIKGRYKSY